MRCLIYRPSQNFAGRDGALRRLEFVIKAGMQYKPFAFESHEDHMNECCKRDR